MAELKKSYISKAILLIRITYPNAYPTKTDEEEQLIIETWHKIFGGYPQKVFEAAFMSVLKSSEFAPKPATILKAIEDMQNACLKSDTELWAELEDVFYEVSDCASMFRFTAPSEQRPELTQGEYAKVRIQEIYEGLDPLIKEYLKGSGALTSLAVAGEEQAHIEKGRFLKMIPILRTRVKVQKETPETVKRIMQGNIALPE